MSLTDKFTKAASWLFNNNGNQVDPTRIRPLDGAPVNTTGINRIAPQYEYGIFALAATASFIL